MIGNINIGNKQVRKSYSSSSPTELAGRPSTVATKFAKSELNCVLAGDLSLLRSLGENDRPMVRQLMLQDPDCTRDDGTVPPIKRFNTFREETP